MTLSLSELTITVRTDGVERVLVADLALEVEESRTTAVVGESGSGKSITALSVLGLLTSELGVAMVRTGDYLSLDPADPETAAEFASWLIHLIPDSGPKLHILPKERWDPMPLGHDTPEDAIAGHLAGTPR
jgi:ABC-type transport system involved in cytochrome bd biosynthesis fused ATPase/permease subunit